MASQPRVIKWIGGPPGEGIWIIKRKYDNYYNKFGERSSVDNAEFIEAYFNERNVKPSALTSAGEGEYLDGNGYK
eukprot:10693364-Heterocapsa_arctica.AAC.1